jgi:hypothetical protein
MSREANPQGDLFISLEPTRDEEQDWGGRNQYQVATLGNIIEEFGFDREVIVSIPTLVRLHLTINNGTTPYHRMAPRVRGKHSRGNLDLRLLSPLGVRD